MKAPTKEQLNDPKWWDESISILAQFYSILPDDSVVFYRKDSCETWQIWGDHSGQWLYDGFSNDAGQPPYKLTHRPTITPEWTGTGRPPVGSDQTVFVPSTAISAGAAQSSDSRWEVVAHHGDSAVVCIDEYGRGKYRAFMVPARFCRPIRTQAQREREDLINAATEILNQDHVLTERDAAEALYEAEMLRRAGE